MSFNILFKQRPTAKLLDLRNFLLTRRLIVPLWRELKSRKAIYFIIQTLNVAVKLQSVIKSEKKKCNLCR